MSHHQVKTLENEGNLWNVWGNLSWFIWPRNEDKWRCNRAKEEGKIEQMSWVLHYLISCQISARPSLTFSLANSFFWRQGPEKGREGGRVVYLVWNVSRCRSTLLCYVLSYISWRKLENNLRWLKIYCDLPDEIQKIFLKFRKYFWHRTLTLPTFP